MLHRAVIHLQSRSSWDLTLQLEWKRESAQPTEGSFTGIYSATITWIKTQSRSQRLFTRQCCKMGSPRLWNTQRRMSMRWALSCCLTSCLYASMQLTWVTVCSCMLLLRGKNSQGRITRRRWTTVIWWWLFVAVMRQCVMPRVRVLS